MALQRLKEAAEKAKIELSSSQSTEINLPFITADASGPKHLNVTLSRAKLEQLVDDLIQRSINPLENCLRDAGIKPSEIDEVILVGGMTRMPKVQEVVKKFFGKEPHKGVNPDEVVAVGAGIQGGVLKGEVKDVLLLDVTPLTLGIETLGGIFTPLIERNTTIPVTKKSEIFSTASDSQPPWKSTCCRASARWRATTRPSGKFHLDGIPPAPRGVPQIEVTFDIDANGILHVSAKDLGTGKEQKITITASSGLSKDEIEKMRRDAEAHAADDAKKREEVETRNRADGMSYEAEKFLKEHGDKVDAARKAKLETSIASLKDAVKANDAARMKSLLDEVTAACRRFRRRCTPRPRSPARAPARHRPRGASRRRSPARSRSRAMSSTPISRWWTRTRRRSDDTRGRRRAGRPMVRRVSSIRFTHKRLRRVPAGREH
jgi:molecular chaperone DnaK